MTVIQRIERIETKVRQLADELDKLRKENAEFAGKNEKLKATLSKSEEMVVDLKHKLEKTQQALQKKQENDPEHSVRLRKQIDKYIEEINKCIEWLENS